MDALGGAASVIAVIQITASIIETCSTYIRGVKAAKGDIRSLQRSVENLEAVVQQINSTKHANGSKLCDNAEIARPLAEIQATLQALQDKLKLHTKDRFMKRVGLTAIKWPLQQTEVSKFIRRLEEQKSTLSLAIEAYQTSKIESIDQAANILKEKFDLKELPYVAEAEYDSFQDQHEDYCLEGTRSTILRKIMDWSRAKDDKTLFWLNGSAGTGKSTISRTIARMLDREGTLGASFFIKRGQGDRANSMMLFPTLAKQLASRNRTPVPRFARNLHDAIKDNRGIGTKSLQEQFEKLLIGPLSSLDSFGNQPQIVVLVIDALDELEASKDLELILNLLPKLGQNTTIRVRILLTSRPERELRLGFSKDSHHLHHEDFILHEIPPTDIKHDLTLFIAARLRAIQNEQSLSSTWPSDEDIAALVRLSTPLFIVAATASRWLEDPRFSPEERLQEILNDSTNLTGFDRIYSLILDRYLFGLDERQEQRLIDEFRSVILPIVYLEDPLTISSLPEFLGIPKNQVLRTLSSFHSMIHVPDDETLPIRPFHLSLRDYLSDPSTDAKVMLWFHPKEIHLSLWQKCLAGCSKLRRNICNLSEDHISRIDIPKNIVDENLPAELRYSCRYWAFHLIQSDFISSEADSLLIFLESRFLHWFEVMGILGHAYEVVQIISDLQSQVSREMNVGLHDLLYELYRFVLRNANMIDSHPLQIYTSGLVFLPATSRLRKIFERHLPHWVRRITAANEGWGAYLQTVDGEISPDLVKFSPDSRQLVTAEVHTVDTRDSEFKLWNAQTGALQLIIHARQHRSWSLAFSKTALYLVSGSSQPYEVAVWNTRTGTDCGRFSMQNLNASDLGSMANNIDLCEWLAAVPDESIESIAERCRRLNYIWRTLTFQSVVISSDLSLYCVWTSNEQDVVFRRTELDSREFDLRIRGEKFKKLIQDCSQSLGTQIDLNKESERKIEHTDEKSGGEKCHLKQEEANDLARQDEAEIEQCDDTVTRTEETPRHKPYPFFAVFSPDENTICVKEPMYEETCVLQRCDASVESCFYEYASSPNAMPRFSKHGTLIAILDPESDNLNIWEVATGTIKHRLGSIPTSVMALSDDGRRLATVGGYGAMIWGLDSPSAEVTKSVDCWWGFVRLSHDGQLLAKPSEYSLHIWDVCTGALIYDFDGHGSRPVRLQFSRDGRWLASGSDHGIVALHKKTSSTFEHIELLNDSPHKHQWINTLVFSTDDSLLAAYRAYSGIIRIWEVNTQTLRCVVQSPLFVYSMAVSQDNAQLVATGIGEEIGIFIFDLSSKNPNHVEIPHPFPYHDYREIAFTKDSQIISCSGIHSESLTAVIRFELVILSADAQSQETFAERDHHVREISVSELHMMWNRGYSVLQQLSSLVLGSRPTPRVINNYSVFSYSNEWLIRFDGKRLWLPSEYRQVIVFQDDVAIAVPHGGRVTSLKFT